MMMQRRIFLSVVLVALVAQVAMAREWTDATGKFKTEAELVKVAGDKVFLKKQSDGATIQVPIAALSAPDQAYLKSLSSAAPELVASSAALPLATGNCIGLLVLDPKPVFEQEPLGMPPLKDMLDQAVGAAGIDFRKVDRVSLFLLMPDLANWMQSKQANFVAVAEFSESVDPASMLSKIPTSYETITVAGKTCHKPATNEEAPWVCVLDEKTLAFAAEEESLARALTTTDNDPKLMELFNAADAKNEIRFAFNLAPLKELIVPLKDMVPPDAAEQAGKVLDAIEKIESFTFTTDLDGSPSIELLIHAGTDSVADLEQAIKDGIAQLPELFKEGMETGMAAAAQQEGAPPMPVNPAMATQMIEGAAEKIDDLLLFEPQDAALKISIKFAPDTPPLANSLVQMAAAFAMMSQMSGSDSPFGAASRRTVGTTACPIRTSPSVPVSQHGDAVFFTFPAIPTSV